MTHEQVGNTLLGYETAKNRYQGRFATEYEKRRFQGSLGRLKNWRDRQIIRRAVLHAGNIRCILDMPCGTGRLLRSLTTRIPFLVGGDLSRDMLAVSRRHLGNQSPSSGIMEYVQCDAEHLPYGDAHFDLVLTGRFLHHLPPDPRVKVLREFARVSRKFVLVDFNMQYGFKYYFRRTKNRLRGGSSKRRRMSSAQVFAELSDAGLQVERIYPVFWLASEKCYILCRKE